MPVGLPLGIFRDDLGQSDAAKVLSGFCVRHLDLLSFANESGNIVEIHVAASRCYFSGSSSWGRLRRVPMRTVRWRSPWHRRICAGICKIPAALLTHVEIVYPLSVKPFTPAEWRWNRLSRRTVEGACHRFEMTFTQSKLLCYRSCGVR
jgi:hypothetical protein